MTNLVSTPTANVPGANTAGTTTAPQPAQAAQPVQAGQAGQATAEPLLDMSGAPLPTRRTLRRRNDLLIQSGKFTGFMLNMMKMVSKAHG